LRPGRCLVISTLAVRSPRWVSLYYRRTHRAPLRVNRSPLGGALAREARPAGLSSALPGSSAHRNRPRPAPAIPPHQHRHAQVVSTSAPRGRQATSQPHEAPPSGTASRCPANGISPCYAGRLRRTRRIPAFPPSVLGDPVGADYVYVSKAIQSP
jgi:hypothetical protein